MRLRKTTLVLSLGAMAALAFMFLQASAAPDAPQPISWDHESCAHCKMLIGEKSFAAQLVTDDGHVLDFDDPGCLLSYLAAQRVKVHRQWFHHVRSDRWLEASEVGFVDVPRSPMGYRLGAVEARAPGALSLDAAAARVRGAR